MRITLFGRTKGGIVTTLAIGGIGFALLAKWAQQPLASVDEAKHDSSSSLQLPSRPSPRDESRETTDRAQYRLSLSMFKHVIRHLESSRGTAVEVS
jgi:hypothetical protein